MSGERPRLNIATPPPGHSFTASIAPTESPAELKVRLFKDVAVFLTALGFVLLIVGICVQTIEAPTASPDAQKWAMSVLSAAASGLIGYLIRK